VFGLAPFLAGVLNGLGGSVNDTRVEESESFAPIEIYGPKNLRGLLRTILKGTYTNLLGRYVVHELQFPGDRQPPYEDQPIHPNELQGRNIKQTSPGLWENFITEDVIVSAGEIKHSIPSIGYVVQEKPFPGKLTPDLVKYYLEHIRKHGLHRSVLSRIQNGEVIALPTGEELRPPAPQPGRKIVILGDTSDSSSLIPLSQNANVVVHEATNAYIPSLDVGMSYSLVQERTVSRGHSTPQMAGKFAAACHAKVLLLNHFSARYADDGERITGKNSVLKAGHETGVMAEIRDLASREYTGMVVCARDLWTWDINDKEGVA
jgi:ribonuclease Z